MPRRGLCNALEGIERLGTSIVDLMELLALTAVLMRARSSRTS